MAAAEAGTACWACNGASGAGAAGRGGLLVDGGGRVGEVLETGGAGACWRVPAMFRLDEGLLLGVQQLRLDLVVDGVGAFGELLDFSAPEQPVHVAVGDAGVEEVRVEGVGEVPRAFCRQQGVQVLLFVGVLACRRHCCLAVAGCCCCGEGPLATTLCSRGTGPVTAAFIGGGRHAGLGSMQRQRCSLSKCVRRRPDRIFRERALYNSAQ